ncbi:MAG: EpsG family protein [Eubacterium sp.]|nr:EpsG family protein [Eubacterium sp.]
MVISLWIIGIAFVALMVSRVIKFTNGSNVIEINQNNETEKIYKGLLLILILWVVYSVVLGCRYGFVDTLTYRLMAQRIGDDFANVNDENLAIVEKGFNLWMVFCNRISNNNVQMFIFLTTTITFALAFIYIYKNSDDPVFSVYLFTALYLFTYINGIRQSFVTVIFALVFSKWKNKPVILLIACIILSFFHNSALMLIPICFCISGSFFNWKIKILYFFSLFCLVGYNQIQKLLDMIISEDYSETLNLMTTGTGIARVLVYSIPFALVMLRAKYHNVEMEDNDFNNIILIDMAINVCSLKSTYFARLSIYFTIFIVTYFPKLIDKTFDKKYRTLAKVFFILFYLAFFVYQSYTFESYGYMKGLYLVPLWK